VGAESRRALRRRPRLIGDRQLANPLACGCEASDWRPISVAVTESSRRNPVWSASVPGFLPKVRSISVVSEGAELHPVRNKTEEPISAYNESNVPLSAPVPAVLALR
jgi:hypothetical protein